MSRDPDPKLWCLDMLGVFTYLFICEANPHGPGRASQGTFSTQLFVGSSKSLTFSHSFHFCRNLIPVLNHSQTEEISVHRYRYQFSVSFVRVPLPARFLWTTF